jgi:hypothetical protein
VGLHRSNVKDSILSYVGQKDPYGNDEWGRVTRNGIEAGKTWPLAGRWWVSGSAGFDYYMGDSVWDNQAVHLDTAVGQTLLFDRDEVSYGLFATAQHFRRNVFHGGLTYNSHPLALGTAEVREIFRSSKFGNVAGSLVTIMAFGIPGDAVTAVMLGALTIHGIQSGPLFVVQNATLAYGMFAAYIVDHALVLAILIGPRRDYRPGVAGILPHNLTLTLLGAGLLWFGWFGFNAGSALEANGSAVLAFMNTFLATACAVLSWTFFEWIFKGKPSMLGAASGAVAGLVAITPAGSGSLHCDLSQGADPGGHRQNCRGARDHARVAADLRRTGGFRLHGIRR